MFEWCTVSQMMKLAAIVVPLAGLALAGSEASRSSSEPAPCPGGGAAGAEEAAVRVVLNAYFEGHASGQADAFRRAFYSEARMLNARDGHFVKTEIADYIARAPGKPAADEEKRRRRIDFVDIVGDAAIAKLTLEYPTVTFTDYMTLLKIDGDWRIVSKVFHADRKEQKS